MNKIKQCNVVKTSIAKDSVRLLNLLWSSKKVTFKLRVHPYNDMERVLGRENIK